MLVRLTIACRDSFHLTKYPSFSHYYITVDLDTTSTSETDTAKAMERDSQRDARFYVSQAFLSN